MSIVPGPKRVQAFTLIEIILVIVLLSVVLVLAVPNFPAVFTNLHLKSSAQEIADLIYYGQSLAVIKGQPFVLQWKEDARSLQLNALDAAATDKISKVLQVSEGMQLEVTSPSMRFDPDGRIEKFRMYLCAAQKCMTIAAGQKRGQVQVLDGRIELK